MLTGVGWVGYRLPRGTLGNVNGLSSWYCISSSRRTLGRQPQSVSVDSGEDIWSPVRCLNPLDMAHVRVVTRGAAARHALSFPFLIWPFLFPPYLLFLGRFDSFIASCWIGLSFCHMYIHEKIGTPLHSGALLELTNHQGCRCHVLSKKSTKAVAVLMTSRCRRVSELCLHHCAQA